MDRFTLQRENEKLKRTLRSVGQEMEYNETVLKRFFDMELRLLSCGRLPELLDIILFDFKRSFKLSAVSLVLFDPEQIAAELLEDYLSENNSVLTLVRTPSVFSQLYPEGAIRTGELDQVTRKRVFPNNPFVLSSALLPLMRHGCQIGSLHLGANDLDRYHDGYRYEYLEHMASVIAVCLENCINQQTLERLSTTDVLTKVHNRRSFDSELNKEINRAWRLGEPLSCLFLDIDHFKRINDNYGHPTGDAVLRSFAQLLKQQLRKTDLIGRYGGEEFAILLPSCDQRQASHVAEGLRKQVEAELFIGAENEQLRVTTSVGVCCFYPELHTGQQIGDNEQLAKLLVKTADESLYSAKQTGRNRVCFKSLQSTSTRPVIDPSHGANHAH